VGGKDVGAEWHYELVTSAPVIEEIEEGDYPQKADVLQLISRLPLLSVDDRVLEVIDVYVQRHVMPRDPRGDAMHLALASCYNCHFLLTLSLRERDINRLPLLPAVAAGGRRTTESR